VEVTGYAQELITSPCNQSQNQFTVITYSDNLLQPLHASFCAMY